jgi:hypothetical protein
MGLPSPVAGVHYPGNLAAVRARFSDDEAYLDWLRWLAGTHQFVVSAEHLQAYLDEFTFRFNRRHSRARGLWFFRLLEGAVTAPPTTMRELIKVPNPHPVRRPPPMRHVWSEILAAEPLDRPWRDT